MKKTNKDIDEQKIEYSDGSRMSPDVQNRIEKGETPLSDNPALPRDKDDDDSSREFETFVASERFKSVVEKFKHYTNYAGDINENSVMALSRMVFGVINKIKQVENANKEYLEELSVDLVKKEYAIPDDAFTFEVELLTELVGTDFPELKDTSDEVDTEEMEKLFGEDSDDMLDDLENFTLAMEKFDMEVAKRRFLNSLIQGASKKGHYMYHLVEDELNRLNPNLVGWYGIVTSANDLVYWLLPESTMAMAGDAVQGTEEVIDDEDGTLIRVKGLFFPVLLHELVKALHEVFATHGLPDDPKAAEMVMGQTDLLPYETWDLRLGPLFWEKFTEAYPDKLFEDDMREIQNYLFSRFSALSTDEFFELSKMILSGSQEGKRIISAMVEEIIEELKEQDYDDAIDDEDEDDNINGLDDLLGGLGISLSDDDE